MLLDLHLFYKRILDCKEVNRSVVRTSREHSAESVKGERADYRILETAPHFLKWLDGLVISFLVCKEESENGSNLRGGHENCSIVGQSHVVDHVIVGPKACVGIRLLIKRDSHKSLLCGWGGENRMLTVRVQRAESLRVVASVNCIDESQISEVVYVDAGFKHHYYPVEQVRPKMSSYLSLRSLTAWTLVLKESSPMHFC